ncbi:MAG: hypothetical protein ACRYFB_09955 [Janthinobacterium lividum]
MEPMTTLSEITNKLLVDGYTLDFNITENTADGPGKHLQQHPEEYIIDKHYRFEGVSDPEDEAIVYAISSVVNDSKGVLINGYGAYSDAVINDLVKNLPQKLQEEQGL